ncbi:MAG TPA: helix-turn-helix domain-containing protein [Nocardioides sp.]|nr:helix-turn-helix domain-containing protein [Nocardioides sp.]
MACGTVRTSSSGMPWSASPQPQVCWPPPARGRVVCSMLVLRWSINYNDIVKTTPSMGPAPSRARPTGEAGAREPLDPSRLRVLRRVAESGRAQTVGDLATVLGGHPNSTRHHLRALVTAGLVQEQEQARAGEGSRRGRPAARYAVTPEGRYAASGSVDGDPSVEEYLALAGAFADRLAVLGVDAAQESRSIGRAWGATLAARDLAATSDLPATSDPADPRRQVLHLLDRLGFSPRTRSARGDEVPGVPEDTREVELRTCPLLDAARRHPEVVCEVHAGLVSGADAAYGGSGEGVRLVPFAGPGACHLTLASAR